MSSHNFRKRLFPIKRDFYGMIKEQAIATTNAVEKLQNWLNSRSEMDCELLFSQADEADQIRFNMEDNLIEAFATPFDRQDIYSLSIEMARIVEDTKFTQQGMEAFGVQTDSIISNMLEQLKIGTDQLVEAMEGLKDDPLNSKIQIARIRRVQMKIQDQCRTGLVELFKGKDVMHAMKYREVYHHIKDAAVHLGYTTDVLHKIVVRVI